jgi:hypothetical protein
MGAKTVQAGRREKQRLTVRCPDGGSYANVEVACLVTSDGVGGHRTLVEITDCSRGKPGRACFPASEDQVRSLVEY